MNDQAFILQTFHRYRPPPEGKGRLIRDDFPHGLTVTAGQDNVTSADIEDWIGKKLACRPEDRPRDDDTPAPPAEETETHA